METEILKIICANQGAVDTDDLLYNLFSGDPTKVSEIICNREKFASCQRNEQAKVVARTRLRLCRVKDCPGTCRGLHLCKNFLFSGVCQFALHRRGCNFCHELNSDHNQRCLREHELESLSRAELCTLLLQSDNTLLPDICHDYNNGYGEFGKCNDGDDCKRLHICEQYVSHECSCSKNHDFNAPQPLKTLQARGVPDTLFQSLKSLYSNKEALRLAAVNECGEQRQQGRGGHLGNRGGHWDNRGGHWDNRGGHWDNRGGHWDNRGGHWDNRGGYLGNRGGHWDNRGGYLSNRGGHWDNRGGYLGNRGGHWDNRGGYLGNSGGYLGNRGGHWDNRGGYLGNRGGYLGNRGGHWDNRGGHWDNRGGHWGNRGGHWGNRGGRGTRGSRGISGNKGNQSGEPMQHRTSSLSDIVANIDALDLYTSDGLNESDGENSPTSDVSAATSDVSAATSDNDASSDRGERKKRTWHPKKVSAAVRGRGGNRGNHQLLQKTPSSSDIHAAVGDDAAKGNKRQNKRQRPVRDKTEICMYFIKGHCKHEDQCFKAHEKMPYRWEVQQGGRWTALPENETIERDYCDPSKSYSSTSPAVHFDTMTCGSDKVRRLSTENSVIQPTFTHTTEWLWYWEDDFGKWNMYSSDAVGDEPKNVNSKALEEKFLANGKDVVEFTAGSQSYSLSFQDMIETNTHCGTKRLVCRRPRFVSAADVLTKKVGRPQVWTAASVPDNWDKTRVPETGYSRIALQRSSGEFKEVEALFCKTMSGFDIVGIERIQNKALWEAFQLQKNQMKSKIRGGNVTEKQLFHGTDSKSVDTICYNNFDCRTQETAFGKGSHFARDAKYFHSYISDTDVRAMFISRVLVGDYTQGSPDYVQPPSKDGGCIHFYNSCVDDVMDPSIFVVFEKPQIYPEYLLQYKTADTCSGGAAPAPTPL